MSPLERPSATALMHHRHDSRRDGMEIFAPGAAALAIVCAAILAACVHAHGGNGRPAASTELAAPQPIVIAPVTRPAEMQPVRAATISATSVAQGRRWDSPAQQRVPLSADDVQLYLSVMRAAAERARHPTAADREAIRTTEAWSAVVDVASRMQARPPAPLDEAMIARSSNLTGQMADVEVASERGIDLARYQWIRDTIESIASPPRVESAECTRDGCIHAAAASPGEPAATLASTIARDRLLLAPRLAEIRALQATVRARP